MYKSPFSEGKSNSWLREGLHVDFASLYSVNWPAADWKSFLHWLPSVVIAAPRQHGKGLLEAALPRSLTGSHPEVPLKHMC